MKHSFRFGLIALFAATIASCHTGMKSLAYMSSDNGDGTYTNPVIRADYPDPDIVRVGTDYYMVSSSFVAMPGIPICHSKDLINWHIIGHAYDSLTFRPEYRMEEGKTAYSRICWAPSIKYHDGVFYIGVNIKDDGFVMFKSHRPEGPYEMYKYDKRLYDPGFFIDDDGKKYVTHGQGDIYITRLKDDATGVMDSTDTGQLIITPPKEYSHYFEGCHTYRRDGWYYVFNPALGYDGVQMISRSRNLFGPYETRVLIRDDMNYVGAGAHQGGYIETAEGESWAYTFQDRDYMGRCLMLYPMRWEDGWPVVGPEGKQQKGVVTYRKPAIKQKSRLMFPQQSDDFSADSLAQVWEFNHVPNPEKWSLTDRRGYLRIYASAAQGFLWARNSLTQKVSGPASVSTALLDISGLADGDFAGSGIMGSKTYQLGVHRKAGMDYIELRQGNRDGERVTDSIPFTGQQAWLRTEVTRRGTLLFSWSADGRTFQPIGREGVSNFWGFLGIRHALCCYNTTGNDASGYADFDSFTIEGNLRGNRYDAMADVDFSMYDDKDGVTFVRLEKKRPMQDISQWEAGGWLQFNNLEYRKRPTSIIITGRTPEPFTLQVRQDSPDGQLLGTCRLPPSADISDFTFTLLKKPRRGHRLCLVAEQAGHDMALRRFQFK